MKTDTRRRVERIFRLGIIVLALIPFVRLVYHAFSGGLGTNPIEEVTHRTGWWTLAFLMMTLSVTPVRKLSGWGSLIKVRRTLGLFAYFYAALHFSTYIGLDQFFAFGFILEDVMDRPFITVGFTGFLLLTPLAITSTKGWVRRLGGKRWKALHSLVYVAAALGVLHFLWLVKADIREPAIFGLVLVTLLGYRVAAERWRRFKMRGTQRSRARVGVEAPSEPAGSSVS